MQTSPATAPEQNPSGDHFPSWKKSRNVQTTPPTDADRFVTKQAFMACILGANAANTK